MKKVILACVASACIPLTAKAADLPAAPALVLAASLAPTWSGFYVGGHLGYGWADFDFRDPTVSITAPGLLPFGAILGVPLERKFHADRVLGGGQAGVNA